MIDVTERHVYAADWQNGRVEFLIDGEHVRTVHQAPDYPMQMMVAVFDFPAHAAAAEHADHVPELAVDHVRGGSSFTRRRPRASRTSAQRSDPAAAVPGST